MSDGCLNLSDGAAPSGLPNGTADLDMLLWDLASTMWVINARGATNHFGTEVVFPKNAGNTEPASIRAARVIQTPTIAANNGGCNNFQSETAATHGIQGPNTEYASILGGLNNLITDNCDGAVVCGGQNNDITAASGNACIGGGNGCIIAGGDGSFIGAGVTLRIQNGASKAVICGGENNDIGRVTTLCDWSAIVGGEDNEIARSQYAFIGGGQDHLIGNTSVSSWSSIIGGSANVLDGNYATCSGRGCDINHDGVTMFADATTGGTAKSSTEANTFATWKTNGRVMANPAMTSGRELYEKQAEGSGSGAGAQIDFTVGTLTADGSVLNVDFEITATRTDGTAGADALAADGHVRARRQGGTVTVFGNTINTDAAGTGLNATVTVVVSGDNLIVRFTIDPGNAENWNVIADWRRRTVS